MRVQGGTTQTPLPHHTDRDAAPRGVAYLVHALGDELALTVDAGEGPVAGNLVQLVWNVPRGRGASVSTRGTSRRKLHDFRNHRISIIGTEPFLC